MGFRRSPVQIFSDWRPPATFADVENAACRAYNRWVESGALGVRGISAPDRGQIQDGLAAEERRFLYLNRALVVGFTARSTARDF
jgi:hypothetical protein